MTARSDTDQTEALLTQGTQRLRTSGIENARMEARLLLGHAMDPAGPLSGDIARHFEQLIERRADHEPFAYIVGVREFYGLDFAVTQATLIPRPDSETLVEAALNWIEDRVAAPTVLDLGTGSGCLLLALLHACPAATGIGIDRSPEATATAAGNAQRLGLAGRARFAVGNWTDAVQGTFDLIVCNPPYITESELANLAPDVRDFEPESALNGGSDGLSAYLRIAPALCERLADGGAAFFEIGAGQADAVRAICTTAGLALASTAKDLEGHTRCLGFTRK